MSGSIPPPKSNQLSRSRHRPSNLNRFKGRPRMSKAHVDRDLVKLRSDPRAVSYSHDRGRLIRCFLKEHVDALSILGLDFPIPHFGVDGRVSSLSAEHIRLVPRFDETQLQYHARVETATSEVLLRRQAVRAFMDSQGIQYITMGDSGGVTSMTSTAGGVLANVFVLDFSVSTNAVSLANLFDEYRMVKVVCDYCPLGINCPPTAAAVIAVPADGNTVIDLDSAAALASYVAAAAYDSHKHFSILSRLKHKWVAKGIPDRAWVSTAAPVTSAWQKWYFTGLSATILYGRNQVWLTMEFRMGY